MTLDEVRLEAEWFVRKRRSQVEADFPALPAAVMASLDRVTMMLGSRAVSIAFGYDYGRSLLYHIRDEMPLSELEVIRGIERHRRAAERHVAAVEKFLSGQWA